MTDSHARVNRVQPVRCPLCNATLAQRCRDGKLGNEVFCPLWRQGYIRVKEAAR